MTGGTVCDISNRIMRILFYTGCLLLVVSFLAAASEPFVVATGSDKNAIQGVFVPAYDLWYSLAPGHLVTSKIKIEGLSPTLWNPFLVGLLQLPAWLLFGGPGLILTWTCRPNKGLTPEEQEVFDRHEESLFIIDHLNKAAKSDDTYHPTEDDRAPVFQLFDEHNSQRESQHIPEIPAGYPSPEDMERIDEAPQQIDLRDLYAEIEQYEIEAQAEKDGKKAD